MRMNGRKLYMGIVLMMGCMLPSFAVPLGAVYDRDSYLYRSLENLALEAQVLMPISTTPVTGHQLHAFFLNIPVAGLSPTARALYDEVGALFADDSGYTRLSSSLVRGGLTLAPEFYLHTNQAENLTEMDWTYRYKDRAPIFSLRGEATIADAFHGVFDFSIKSTRGYSGGGTTAREDYFTGVFTHNISFAEYDWNDRAPFSAFMSYSRPHFSLIFGRDTVAWGRGNTGDMVIGGEADFHDFLQYTLYTDTFAYTFNAMFFDDIKNGQADNLSFYDQGKRIFTAKRFEASVSPRLRLALSASILYYASGLDLRMFNPLMWEHNFVNQSNDYTSDDSGIEGRSFNEVNNAMALEVEVAVAPGWGVYGQFFIDQIQLGSEVSGGEFDPNAFGALAGAQFSRPYREGRLTGFAELAYTTPGLYMKQNPKKNPTDPIPENPTTDYYAWHRYKMLSNLPLVRANSSRDSAGVGFIGYQYGPDTFVAAASAAYEVPDAYALQADVEFSIHGEYGLQAHGRKENYLKSVTSPTDMLALQGILEYRLALGIGGSKVFSDRLEGFTRLDGVAIWNRRNQTGSFFGDLQLSIGATFSLDIL